MKKLMLPAIVCLLAITACVNEQKPEQKEQTEQAQQPEQAQQQEQSPEGERKEPPASPRQVVKQDLGFSSVEVSYSRPVAKGRTIMGELVPYDAVWRTGANAATTITFSKDVTFGGQPVKAGKYGLLTIPGASSWTIILSSSLDVTSPDDYKQENDVVRVQAVPEELPIAIESFMINFDEVLPTSMTMILAWENTLVPVVIEGAK